MSEGDCRDESDWSVSVSEYKHGHGDDGHGMRKESFESFDLTYEEDFDPEEEEEDEETLKSGGTIQYKAPIGPNIMITNTKSGGKVVSSAISLMTMPTYDSKRDVRGQGESLISAISSIVDDSNYNYNRAPRGKKKVPGNRMHMSTKNRMMANESQRQKISQTISKLKVGNSPHGDGLSPTTCKTSIRYQKSTIVNRRVSTLSFGKPFQPLNANGIVGKRVDSAKRLQIKDLMSKVHALETRVENLTLENKTLKTVHFRQDKALRKYEGEDADLPKMLLHHKNELYYLQATVRKASAKSREYEEMVRTLNQKILKLEQENKRLATLVEEGHLGERHDLREKLKIADQENKKLEEKLDEYKRHMEILEKNHHHQISVEHAKFKHCNKTLSDVQHLLDQMSDLVRQKDNVINYFKMRSSRNPDIEPPMFNKMVTTQNEIMKKKASLGRRTPPGARSPERERPTKHGQNARGLCTRRTPGVKLASSQGMEEKGNDTELYTDDFEYDEDNASDFSGSADGEAEISATMSLNNPSNPVCQNQDYSNENDGNNYRTEFNDHQADLSCDEEEPNELDPNNLEEYYYFDPNIKEEDLSDYSPRKSLYLEALGTSCSDSSKTSTPLVQERNNEVMFGMAQAGTGCGDRESTTPVMNSFLPVTIEAGSSGRFRTPASSLTEHRFSGSMVLPSPSPPKETNEIGIGPDGDSTFGNLSENSTMDKRDKEQSSPRQMSDRMERTPRKIAVEIQEDFQEALPEPNPQLMPQALASAVEPGFVPQREINPIKRSIDQVRLAELREAMAQSHSQPQQPEESSGSESQEEDTAGEEDEELDDENMKLYFKVSKPTERNLNDTQSFQDIRRVNKMLEEPTAQAIIPICPRPPPPEYDLKPFLSTPNIRSANMVPRMNQFSRSTKEAPGVDKLELPAMVKPFSTCVIDGSVKSKAPSTNVFDSPLFSSVNSPIPVTQMVKRSGFFDSSPSPPKGAMTHYNFDAMSIFHKDDVKFGTLGAKKSEESLIQSKARTQSPRNIIQHSPRSKPNLSHSESQTKVITRKPSNTTTRAWK